jgi:hypothetical protein
MIGRGKIPIHHKNISLFILSKKIPLNSGVEGKLFTNPVKKRADQETIGVVDQDRKSGKLNQAETTTNGISR